MFTNLGARRLTLVAALIGSATVTGCGGPKTYPVRGTVELAGGDIQRLAGSHVEAMLATDPAVRASGAIQEDGKFHLESLHNGTVYNGALRGTYRVRIILTDDDAARRRLAGQAIAPRFLDFASSGISLDVPAGGAVTIAVAPP